ncbi:hybrid signal transduction histidine kinase M [Tanacetum coccineum]
MAVEDTSTPSPTDKIIPFSIPNKVHIKLDLEKHNYNSWSSFSLIHLGSLGLKAHVKNDTAIVTTPGNAKALWDHLKDLFHDNKDARAISLDNELRAVKIGKMSINEYCTKIKSMANRLKNLDCEVSEKNMVIYAVNGLDSRFATLFEIIRHREPLPSFETVRNMLLLKESSFNDSNDASTMLESSSLSPTILLASSSSDDKGNNSSKPLNNLQLCNHFSRGTYKFRDLCKFVYDHRNRAGLNSRVNTTRTTVPGQSNWGTFFGGSSNNQVQRLAQSRPTPFPPQPLVAHVFYTATGPTMAHPVTHQQHQSSSSAHQPIVYMAQQNSQAIPGQPTSQPNNNGNGNGILGPAPVFYASQPTAIPSAFSTMTLQDPT